MPRFDLRQDDGTLHPLASFKVLAVMCHPSNLVPARKNAWDHREGDWWVTASPAAGNG